MDITGRCTSHALLTNPTPLPYLTLTVSVIEMNWDNWPQLGAALKQNMNFEHNPERDGYEKDIFFVLNLPFGKSGASRPNHTRV